ncbi:5'-nucleotidase, lipoprotein e(P4) family [Dongia sp.]|uniref:5'-nucleotidase, lipoprotein e(P4) family n=1 Tax=Dongia sp. TaxID=1977262 RepID=UPI0037532458
MHRTRLFALAAALLFPLAAAAQESTPAAPVTPDDNLNAVLWMQHSVEYQASTMAAFALAKRRLIQAMGDPWWTAVPEVQKGNYSKLPPAIILDADETVLDNSKYQAWNVTAGTSFSNDTWKQFVEAKVSTAVPGAVAFTGYANARGIKVFYVTNRTADMEQATRENMQALKFPMGGNVDTFLFSKEKEDWTSAKGTRRAFIAKNYRVLLLIGDNFGDFVDAYKGSEADRQKVFDDSMAHWTKDWIMLPNPSYGSFEAVPYGFNYGAPPDEMRDAKKKTLTSWGGPTPAQ